MSSGARLRWRLEESSVLQLMRLDRAVHLLHFCLQHEASNAFTKKRAQTYLKDLKAAETKSINHETMADLALWLEELRTYTTGQTQ